MTTYAEFQTNYIDDLWRTGDTALASALPRMMKKAEAQISRDLRDSDMVTMTALSVAEGANFIDLPADFREVIAVVINAETVLSSTGVTSSPDRSKYAILGNKLYLPYQAIAASPIEVHMTYYMGIVPYETEPAVPFYDKHPDFYTAALNVHAYDYLREFTLKAQNEATYESLKEGMIRSSNYARWPSGQLAGVFPTGKRDVTRPGAYQVQLGDL